MTIEPTEETAAATRDQYYSERTVSRAKKLSLFISVLFFICTFIYFVATEEENPEMGMLESLLACLLLSGFVFLILFLFSMPILAVIDSFSRGLCKMLGSRR
jgi:hypothetical protein